jgi:hypothetical protein
MRSTDFITENKAPEQILQDQDMEAAVNLCVSRKRRWPAAEEFIIQDFVQAITYNNEVVAPQAWPEFQQAIMRVKAQFVSTFAESVGDARLGLYKDLLNNIQMANGVCRNIVNNVGNELATKIISDLQTVPTELSEYLFAAMMDFPQEDFSYVSSALDESQELSRWTDETSIMKTMMSYLEDEEYEDDSIGAVIAIESGFSQLLTDHGVRLADSIYREQNRAST